MNNKVEDIIKKIEEYFLNPSAEGKEEEEILNEIRDLTDINEKNELFNLFVQRTKEAYINDEDFNDITKEEVEGIITELREELKNNGGLSESEIDTLLNNNNFNVENLYTDEESFELSDEPVIEENEQEMTNEETLEEENEQEMTNEETLEEENEAEELTEAELEEREIDKINRRISELAAQLDGKTSEELEKEKSEKTKALNEEIKAIEEQLNEEKRLDVERYDTENLEIMLENRLEEKRKIENQEKILLEAIEKNKQEIQDVVERLNGKKIVESEVSHVDINGYDIENLKIIYKKKLEEKEKLEQELQGLNINKKTVLEADEEIQQIQEELQKRKFAKYTDEQLTSLLMHYKNGLENLSPEDQDKKTKIQQSIVEIEQELNKRNNRKNSTNKSDLEQKLEELKQHQKDLQSEYDKKISITKELESLKEIRDAYNKIQSEAIVALGQENIDDNELLNKAIEDFLNNHESTKKLDEYENVKQLKEELHREIFNKLEKKKEDKEDKEEVKEVEKKEQNTKLLYKALAGVAGFAAGLAASAVPGVATIKMGIAGAKLVTAGINCWTEKHSEGIIAKLKEKLKEKCPTITKKVNKMKSAIKSEPLKWAINGFAAGYITGNVIEMITGESILEHLRPDPEPVPDPVVIEDPKPVPPLPDPSDIELEVGKVYDISMLDKGYVSSYSNKAVSIMEEIGKNVEVDKFNIVNGEKWVHFKQLNGKGYSWFKYKDVQEALAKVAEQASTKSL